MKAALVGLGYWGKRILPIIKKIEDSLGFKLIWVCDHHRENWSDFQARWPGIIFDCDFDALLQRHRVDVVFIATQPTHHFSLASRSLQRGCHVFLEKPFIGNLDSAREIKEEADSRKLVVSVGYRLIYSPSVQLLKKEHLSVSDGKPITIEATWKQWGKHQKGGVHWDLGSHYIAVINYLYDKSGDVVSAVPLCISDSGDVENISLVIKHRDNLSKVDVSWNSAIKQKEMVVTTRDKLYRIAHDEAYPFTVYDRQPSLLCYQGHAFSGAQLRACERHNSELLPEKEVIEKMFSHFILAVRKGKEEVPSLSIAMGAIETLNRIDQIIRNP